MKAVQYIATLAAVVAFCPVASAGEKVKADKKKLRVLMLTQSKGFTHGSVRRKAKKLAPAEIAMTELGQKTGLFTVDCTQDAARDFTKENLKNYDIVMFYTTGELPISKEARDFFLNEWLKQKGHGFIGFHSATDTYRNKKPEHAWYREMINGTFNGHPWGAGSTVAITVHDSKHPGMVPFGESFTFRDEIYQYRGFDPKKVRVLMSLNMAGCKTKRPYHVPVAWCREWGKGRIFYNNLGHRNETWADKRFLQSVVGAVKWINYEVEGDATPNPGVSAEVDAASKKAASK